MGLRYKLPWDDIASGAVANTYRTIAAIIAADTAGYRLRLRSMIIGPADDSPADYNCLVKIARVDDVSAGSAGTAGSTVSAADMPKIAPNQRNAVMTGGIDYSGGEPSTYHTVAMWQGAFNLRGGIIKEWAPGDGPEAHRDMLMGLLVAPLIATAVRTSGCLEFEEF